MELFGEQRNNNSKKVQADPTSIIPLVAATPRADMMEQEPTIAINTNSTHVGKNTNGYPLKQPEDQALLGKHAKQVDKNKISTCWREGRCLRCGRDRYWIEQCLLAAAIPLAGNNMPVSRAKVTEAAVEEPAE